MQQSISILVTGGTFDKSYDDINGRLFFRETHVPEILKLGRAKVAYKIRTLMMMDSLDLTEDDRHQIATACAEEATDRILITHGTDTMVKTALLLQSHQLPKTIILTGAMIPYEFGSSDGLFNLGSALAYSQMLPYGVYVAMNGRYFTADNVKKNKETGFFEELNA